MNDSMGRVGSMADDEYISFKEAASVLSLSPSTLRRMFIAGELKGHKTPGGHRRLLRKDVFRVLEARDTGISFPPKE